MLCWFHLHLLVTFTHKLIKENISQSVAIPFHCKFLHRIAALLKCAVQGNDRHTSAHSKKQKLNYDWKKWKINVFPFFGVVILWMKRKSSGHESGTFILYLILIKAHINLCFPLECLSLEIMWPFVNPNIRLSNFIQLVNLTQCLWICAEMVV